MIQIVDNQLTQWDVGRFAQVTGNATHVHFANQGDSKAVIIEIEAGQAKIPDYLLQTGKTVLAYAVLDGVTLESYSFPVKKRERPENYVYADDQRNYIYELIQSAEDAIEASNAAAGSANEAAAKATESAGVANQAAGAANEAAANANTAADKAVRAAGTFLVVGTARGERMVLTDAAEQYLVGCRIFGKSTQDGVPSPDAPVEIESVENPTLAVNEQSMVIPYTLRGIPVSKGGNYTDANGQQWICDEVDLARGVYVNRVAEKVFNGGENWVTVSDAHVFGYQELYPIRHPEYCLCSHSSDNRVVGTGFMEDKAYTLRTQGFVYFKDTSISTVDEWKAMLSEQYVYGAPVMLQYVPETPIEVPLSEEEIAAYKALYTSRGTTTISNDAGAWMEIEYVMDAKKYIDSMITGTMLAATVE